MNWDVFTKLSTIQVQLHWLFAVVSFLLGISILIRKKGTRSHIILGRTWVGLMLVVSVSAVFITGHSTESQTPSYYGYSPIHLLIPFTLILLFLGVKNARAKKINRHKKIMTFTFIGSLIVAGAFTFLPGRHMHTFFFGTADQVEDYIERGYKK